MKNGLIRQWVFVGMIPIGVLGLLFDYRLIWLIPIGFIGCGVNAVYTSLVVIKKVEKFLDKK